MLLKTKKIIKYSLILGLGIYFTGCSNKSYYSSTWSGSSSSSSSTRTYKHIPDEKIRNSKAMHRATMRSYTIAGKRYSPSLSKVGNEYRGIASWYGPNFHAKKTSNGEVYNMYAMTAAHKTLPMNTMVQVDNLENGKSIVVRINDRGPFVSGRIIDLSNKAAHKIDMVKKGTAQIKVTVLGFNAKIATTAEEKQAVATVGRYYVQVGAFTRYEGAKITKNKFEMILENNYKVIIKKGYFNDKPINRVWVSGFRSEEEARDFKSNNGLNGAMIIGA